MQRASDERPAAGAGPVIIGIIVVAAAFFIIGGVWAFFAPESFFRNVATYPPYNRHLLHDLGAFQLGLGVTLLAALRWRDALFVGLLGVGAGSAFHAVAHFLDTELGGRASDPYSLGAFFLLVAAGVVLRGRSAT